LSGRQAVTHHKIAAGVSLQAGAAIPASHRGRNVVSSVIDADLIVGVDTHLDTHTAALCDARGRTVSQLQVAATSAGYAELLEWADSAAAGRPVAWAIEGTRHYGLGLARYLAGNGRQVAEIDATRHVGRRRAGKSDPIDAVRATRELMAHTPRFSDLITLR
jgi:transposase